MAINNFNRLSDMINAINVSLKTKDKEKIYCEKSGRQARVYDVFESRFVNLTDTKLAEIGHKLRNCKNLDEFWRDIDGSPRRRRSRSRKKQN